ncbi:MAG: hypothetical protein BGO51_08290 [Rhodospirillales bacterium 69-11]|nr:MAG: hypothetical protein BGO51_08290 [Rhodospirillales bacterium 69-11]
MLTRRSALLGLGTAVALGRSRLALAQAATDRRFVVVILRGAMDGLGAVVPYGDPELTDLRGALVPPDPGRPDGLHDLGGRFGLHPALVNLHAMYAAGTFAPIHAVAGPYRMRSHFEAQDCLESGADHRMTSGWLNRAVAALPRTPDSEALAVGVTVPLLLRGGAEVGTWAPHGNATPSVDMYARITELNAPDPVTGPAIGEGLRARGFSDATLYNLPQASNRAGFPALAAAAGKLLAAPRGPRIAALELDGWDTHAAQATRLPNPLRQLDAGLAALAENLGPAWAQTAVLVMTEFGRTARINGTGGTDHGTAGVAFVLGGAVAGGRILGTWPGLNPTQLFENRDLAPTSDLRAVAKGLLAGQFGLGAPALTQVFPDSASVEPMGGLLRT